MDSEDENDLVSIAPMGAPLLDVEDLSKTDKMNLARMFKSRFKEIGTNGGGIHRARDIFRVTWKNSPNDTNVRPFALDVKKWTQDRKKEFKRALLQHECGFNVDRMCDFVGSLICMTGYNDNEKGYIVMSMEKFIVLTRFTLMNMFDSESFGTARLHMYVPERYHFLYTEKHRENVIQIFFGSIY